MQYDDDYGNDNVEGNFVDWDNLNMNHDSAEKQDFKDKSPWRDKNNVDFPTQEENIDTSTQVVDSKNNNSRT